MVLGLLDRPTLPSRRSARGSRTTYRLLPMRSLAVLAKNAFVAPFYTKTNRFTKTGSGQTEGKLKKRGVSFRRCFPRCVS